MHSMPSMKSLKGSSKNQIALTAKLVVILVPFAIIYWQDLDLVLRESLSNDFMNYVLIVPFLIGYIIYRKRKMLKAVAPMNGAEEKKRVLASQTLIGVTLLAIGFLTYLFGSYTTRALEYHLLSIPFFLAGGIALAFNLKTLITLLFPIALLFFIQPYLIQLALPFWSDLSWISSTIAYNILRIITVPARFTSVLDVPTIEIIRANGETLPFTVGVASSGLNSFMGFTLFSVFVVYILREPLWKRITLMLVGYPLLILLNALRISIILGLAYEWGIAVAEIFHLTGGVVLIFIGTLLLLFIGEKIWRMKINPAKPKSTSCTYCNSDWTKKSSYCISCGKLLRSINHGINRQSAIGIALLMSATLLFLLIQTPPIILAKPPTEVDLTKISEAESEKLLPAISGWKLDFLYRDRIVENILKQDVALMFAYVSKDNSSVGPYASIFVGIQIGIGTHSWEWSVIYMPARYGYPTATVLDLRDIKVVQDPAPLTARFFAYQRPDSNRTEVVLYWYERVPFKIGSTWEMRNVQITIMSYSNELASSGLISDPHDLAGVQKAYLPIAQSIVSYWQPIKTTSYITVLVSSHVDIVLIAISILPSAVIILHVVEERRDRKKNTEAYRKLSEPDKRLIDIIHETETTTVPTLKAIAIQYTSVTGETIKEEKLFQKLVEAEKTGVIRSSVTNQYDEPIQIWKTQVNFKRRF